MKALLAAAAVAATIASATAAQASGNFVSGNSWMADCISPDVAKQVGCYMFACGVADGLVQAEGRLKDARTVCMSENVIATQLVEVGVAWIRSHPADRHQAAANILTIAWWKAWPCQPDHDDGRRS